MKLIQNNYEKTPTWSSSLSEDDDFDYDSYQDEFYLDTKEDKEDSFKDISNFLPTSTIELKPLPCHLKYTFLGSNETLRMIISSLLSP